jgi:hypothetical protein
MTLFSNHHYSITKLQRKKNVNLKLSFSKQLSGCAFEPRPRILDGVSQASYYIGKINKDSQMGHTKKNCFYRFQGPNTPDICKASSIWKMFRNYATNQMEITIQTDSTTISFKNTLQGASQTWWLNFYVGPSHWLVHFLGGSF